MNLIIIVYVYINRRAYKKIIEMIIKNLFSKLYQNLPLHFHKYTYNINKTFGQDTYHNIHIFSFGKCLIWSLRAQN